MRIKQSILKRLVPRAPKALVSVFIFALTATTQGATNFYTKLQNGDNVKMMNMGTSLSYGYALPEATRVANRWAGQLQTHLNGLFPGQTTIDNQAISASNSGNANTNFVTNGNGLQIIDNRLANHTAGTLDLVVFEYATNDAYTGFTSGSVSLAETTTNLNSLISKVKAHSPNAEIILLAGTFFQPGSTADTTRPDIELYNTAWKNVAAADADVYYADAYAVFKSQQAADPTNYKADYVPDDIHPSVAGHTTFRDAMMGTISNPQVSIVGIKSTTPINAFKNDISATDLINEGRGTFSSATVTGSHPFGFVNTGINDGISTDSGNDNTFFYKTNGDFPATATYHLNVSTYTLGYNITSIQSLMGWATASSEQANQIYSVEVSEVSSASYTTLANVNYTPFSGVSGGAYDTKVTMTENASGILATGIDSIRFTFSDPGGTSVPGTLIREIDVMGSPVVGASYVAWQNTHWGGSVADADPFSDPDEDGLNNLLEFAFDSNPKNSNHSQSILTLENGAFRVTRRVAAAANLNYIFESSTTLLENSWTTVPSLIVTPVTSDGTIETVDLTRAGGWDSATKEFYRLRVIIAH